jgi:threonine/homoserine/homoserine lactone efflux protein
VSAWFVGLLSGFFGSLAGPVAALAFGRALENRARGGLALALGATVAEGVWVFLACLGFAGLLERFPWIEPASQAATAGVLLGVGVAFLRRRAPKPEAAAQPGDTRRSFTVGLLVGALNPTLLLTWCAMAAMLHGAGLLPTPSAGAVPFSLGAMAGMAAWFALLIALVARFRVRLGPASLTRIVNAAGAVLTLSGVVFAARLLL